MNEGATPLKKYKIDVYLVDDHTMFCEGLTDVLNHSETVHISRCFTTLNDCRSALAERCPDVLLLDISMPDGDGTSFCQWMMKEYPKVLIVAVTIHDEYSVIRHMLDAGVNGYVLKSAPVEELAKAICTVWKGQNYISQKAEEILRAGSTKAVVLTGVEQNILRLICDGMTNPQIAQQMGLSTETINWYRKRLLAKFGVNNTASLIRLAIKEHLHLNEK